MVKLMQQRNFVYGTVIATSVIALGVAMALRQNTAVAQGAMVEAPIFEVDPLWPKPLPNEGLLGNTIGVSIDAQDNVWTVHRGAANLNNNEKGSTLNPPVSICCARPRGSSGRHEV